MFRNSPSPSRPWHARDPLEMFIREARRLESENNAVRSGTTNDADRQRSPGATRCACPRVCATFSRSDACCESTAAGELSRYA